MILAAGASSRLGSPKQLLTYKDQTLLQYSLQQAINSQANAVVIILGANAKEISNSIDKSVASIKVNDNWEEGMASSIRDGLSSLLKQIPDLAAVIFMVCDQPYVTSALINDLLEAGNQTENLAVVSRYQNSVGIPALFKSILFGELLALQGDAGAKKIIQKYADHISYLDFEKGEIDIDTPEDYRQLNKMVSK